MPLPIAEAALRVIETRVDPHVANIIAAVTDAVTVAAIGIFTTLISTVGIVIAAMVNNRRERSGSADAGITATLRERLALRDEQIEDLKNDKQDLARRLDDALSQVEEKTLLVRHLRAELENKMGDYS